MHKAQRKRVRRAGKALRAQQRQLLTMELDGLVVLTLHLIHDSLTLPLDGDTAAQVVSLLLETLQERRQQLRREATDLREAREKDGQREAP